MASARLVFLLCSLLTLSARAALDLSPSTHEYVAEGITFRQLSFNDGDRKVVYEPPVGWSFVRLGDQLRLTPAKLDGASAVIAATNLVTAEAKTDEGMRSTFRASLPPTAQDVEMLAEEVNPLVLDGGVNTYEITAAYQLAGERYVCGTVFANAAETQIMFRLSARKADFERLHAAFRSSLLSWHWVERKAAAKAGEHVVAATTGAPSN